MLIRAHFDAIFDDFGTGSTLLRTAHLLRTDQFQKIKINCSYGTLSISRNLKGTPFTNLSESVRIQRNLAAARRPKIWELCPFSSRKIMSGITNQRYSRSLDLLAQSGSDKRVLFQSVYRNHRYERGFGENAPIKIRFPLARNLFVIFLLKRRYQGRSSIRS